LEDVGSGGGVESVLTPHFNSERERRREQGEGGVGVRETTDALVSAASQSVKQTGNSFSNVSSILILLCKMRMELTVENFSQNGPIRVVFLRSRRRKNARRKRRRKRRRTGRKQRRSIQR